MPVSRSISWFRVVFSISCPAEFMSAWAEGRATKRFLSVAAVVKNCVACIPKQEACFWYSCTHSGVRVWGITLASIALRFVSSCGVAAVVEAL